LIAGNVFCVINARRKVFIDKQGNLSLNSCHPYTGKIQQIKTMAQTALEKIKAIEAEAEAKIKELKAEAVSELVKKIAAVKSELEALEAEYSTLTGKTLKGEKTEGKRKRLSADEKAALVATVAEIIKAAKDGVSFGEIAKQAGESDSAVRDAIKQVKGIKSTGTRATTKYSLK